MTDTPWLKFYPRDWRGDQALRAVSIAARGLWMECICIMHEAKPYGHLVLNGAPIDGGTLARMTGTPVDEVSALVAELRQAGVLSVTGRGVVFSRRMTKDHARAQKGRKSANLRWSQAAENKHENDVPNRHPIRYPITQKPEARNQKDINTSGGALRSRESEREKPEPAKAPAAAAYDGLDAIKIADQVCAAMGPNADRTALGIASVKPILDLIRTGHDLEKVILPALRDASRKPRRDPIRSFDLIARIVTDWIAKPSSASVPEVREMVTLADHSRLAKAALIGFIERFQKDGVWLLEARTPPPGAPGCLIPRELIPNDTELAS